MVYMMHVCTQYYMSFLTHSNILFDEVGQVKITVGWLML